MNRHILFTFLLFLLPFFMQEANLTAQLSKEPRLYVKTTQVNGDYMEITYEITSPGFVELHLFNPEKEKIWIRGRVTNRIGVDVIRIPRKPLKPGERYTFMLKYKGSDYNGSFYSE